jgi:hypothetical protein
MHKLTLCAVCCLTVLLGSCKGRLEEHVTEVVNGSYKVLIRSQEYYHSATVNIDVCVAEVSSHTFPTDHGQCFFHGFDFDGLSVKWKSDREIEVSLESGWVSQFRNYAFVYPRGSAPVEFHTILCDGCRTPRSSQSP